MDELTRTIAERGDLAHLALACWATGASALLVWALRELAEAKNQLDGLRLQAQNALDEAEGATDEQKSELQEAVTAAGTAIDNEKDKEKLDAQARELAEKLQKFQVNTAPKGEQEQPAESPTETVSADDDVIDADFKPAG